jgi:CheY-like chemotaxis protein/tetratricopeptide (TPR) repeat protein
LSSQSTSILILEDDDSIMESLRGYLTRMGHTVLVAVNESDVFDCIEKKKPSLVLIDCLLPSMNGVEVAEKIKKTHPQLPLLMMSGIYIDSQFIKDTMRSTNAVGFLKKPFDLSDLDPHLASLEKNSGLIEVEEAQRRKLYQIFNKSKVSGREKKKLIESLEEVHGFDLPFVYSLLVESKSSGHLNVVGRENGDVSGISLSNGVIVQVDISDQSTYLGRLLIDSGFVSNEDLDGVLASSSNRRLGERLIGANLLSPHGFDAALEAQMNIRLSRIIKDEMFQINFVAADVDLTFPHLDSEALVQFLHDWVASKITLPWLKSHYLQWMNFKIQKGPVWSPHHAVFEMPLVQVLPQFLLDLEDQPTLQKLLESEKYPEEALYKALHLLAIKGMIIFVQAAKQDDTALQRKMLEKIKLEFSNKKPIDIFDQMVMLTGSSSLDPEKVYIEFLRMIGKAPSDGISEGLYEEVIHLAQSAVEFEKTGNRKAMKDEIQKAEIEVRIKAAAQFEEAKNCLPRAQYPQALHLLRKAYENDHALEKIRLYLIWAKLGTLDSSKNRKQSLKDIELDIMQIPPEDRYEALYSFVIGLYQKALGDMANAKKYFEKSLALDASLMAARRELSMISRGKAAKDDIFNKDLKDLVTGFFKRK